MPQLTCEDQPGTVRGPGRVGLAVLVEEHEHRELVATWPKIAMIGDVSRFEVQRCPSNRSLSRLGGNDKSDQGTVRRPEEAQKTIFIELVPLPCNGIVKPQAGIVSPAAVQFTAYGDGFTVGTIRHGDCPFDFGEDSTAPLFDVTKHQCLPRSH